MRAMSVLLIAAAGLLACQGTQPQAAAPGPERLVILHTNDLHGQLLSRPGTWVDKENPPAAGGYGALVSAVGAVRAEGKKGGFPVFLVSAGDIFSGTPEGDFDSGRTVVDAYNRLGYDAAALGNHEFDRGVDNMLALVRRADYPILAGNLRDADGAVPSPLNGTALVEKGGVTIAFVGLLTEGLADVVAEGRTGDLKVGSAAKALREAIAQLERGPADLVVPLTHIGVGSDKRLARDVPGLTLIVGGHSHTGLPRGTKEGNTTIVQTWGKCGALGRVDMARGEDGKWIVEKASHIELVVADVGEDRAAADWLEERTGDLRARMDEVVGELTAPAGRNRSWVSSPAGNLVCDAMLESSGADVSFQNKGGIRKALAAGPVTRRDAYEILPFGNVLVTMTMSGADLKALVSASVVGRGNTGLEVGGLVVDVAGRDIRSIRVGGAPLVEDRAYTLVTNSFLADKGDGYEGFAAGKVLERTDITLEAALVAYLAKYRPATPSVEQRVKRVR